MPMHSSTVDRLHVVAAVITDRAGRVLLAKRPQHLHQGGLWEFPGGKREAGEEISHTLVRELYEELGITPTQFRPMIGVKHNYPDRKVFLDVWRVSAFKGTPHGAEGQELRWVEAENLPEFSFPAANRPIVTAAMLPDSYLITPDPGGAERWPQFLAQLEATLEGNIELVQFRAKGLNTAELMELSPHVVQCCHDHGCRVMLNGEPELARTLGYDGVHLGSARMNACHSRPLPGDYLVAASCHNAAELHKAATFGCDFVVLGPVCATATHPEASEMGWVRFAQLVERCALPVYALGGMGRDDYDRAWRHGAQGIAAIRALWKGEV